MSEASALLDLAVRAARAAGQLLLDRFGETQTGVDAKSSRTDLVSDADRDAEALLVGTLRAERPDDGLVAEEGATADGRTGLCWFVDPLDGTINYLWGIPHWSVSVAVVDGEGDLVAVVHDPCRDETVTASRGNGCWRDGHRCVLSPSDDLDEALVGTGFAYSADERARQAETLARFLPHVRDVRRAGSAALDLAWLAAGRLDAYYETGLAAWDWAAGRLLVREAGGTVEALVTPGRPDGVVAARPGLGPRLRALIEG